MFIAGNKMVKIVNKRSNFELKGKGLHALINILKYYWGDIVLERIKR